MVNYFILIIKSLIKDFGNWMSFMATEKSIMTNPPCLIRLLILPTLIVFRNSGSIIRANLDTISNRVKAKLCLRMVSIFKDYSKMTGLTARADSLICMEI